MNIDDENIMQFWPLPNLVGKIYVDSSSESDCNDIEQEKPIIKNWSQSNINQSQSIVSFDDIVDEENSCNKNNFKINDSYSCSQLNENNDSNYSENVYNYPNHEKSFDIVFGQKKQPELPKNENQDQSNSSEQISIPTTTDFEIPNDNKNIDEKHQIEKKNLQKLVIVTKKKQSNNDVDLKKTNKTFEIQAEESNHEVKIEKNNYIKKLPHLSICINKSSNDQIN